MSVNPNEKTATHYRLRKSVKEVAGEFARMQGMSKSAYAEEAIKKYNEEQVDRLEKAVKSLSKHVRG